jgi:hypothetical protein
MRYLAEVGQKTKPGFKYQVSGFSDLAPGVGRAGPKP